VLVSILGKGDGLVSGVVFDAGVDGFILIVGLGLEDGEIWF